MLASLSPMQAASSPQPLLAIHAILPSIATDIFKHSFASCRTNLYLCVSIHFSTMPALLDFCHEILHDIIIQVYPEDLAALSASCQTLNKYIRGNRLLWRDVYLRHFVS
jgi:hypothetical protein